MKRIVVEEKEYQSLPSILKDPSRFCRVIRKQAVPSTSCLKLKYKVTKI